tara:strand:+ start:3920 stop:4093 length:174 start_codon:yes stop_codon:yes gene_type:complete
MLDMDLIKAAISKGQIDPDMQAILNMLIMYNITRKQEYIDDTIYSLALHSMIDEEEE